MVQPFKLSDSVDWSLLVLLHPEEAYLLAYPNSPALPSRVGTDSVTIANRRRRRRATRGLPLLHGGSEEPRTVSPLEQQRGYQIQELSTPEIDLGSSSHVKLRTAVSTPLSL